MPSPAPDPTLRAFRALALVEGVSFLVILLVTMPLKYGLDLPGPNRVVGMAHGLLFVAYLGFLIYIWSDRRWPARTLLWGLAASVVPFLMFWVERRVFPGGEKATMDNGPLALKDDERPPAGREPIP